MSYREAIEDGIPISKDSSGFQWYYPPCKTCGASVRSWNYIKGTKYVCKECRQILAQSEAQKKWEEDLPKKDKKMNDAIKRIAKVANIIKYQEAIYVVRSKLDTPGWFQSTEEIMTAIELEYRKVKSYHQVKVHGFTVDFVLPDYGVALEIDGEPFHRKEQENRSKMRDEVISDGLGGYEVIHIKTENINSNVTRLMKGIKEVLKYRKRSKGYRHVTSIQN